MVTDNYIDFCVSDPDEAFEGVGLLQEVARPRHALPFVRLPGTGEWRLHFPRPRALRMEYRLELQHRDGTHEVVCDPGAQVRAGGPFGERSVIEMPGYERPKWIDADDPPAGEVEKLMITSHAMQEEIHGLLWRSHGTNQRQSVPLLIVHDGPEFAEHAWLLRFLDHMVAECRLPPMRAALLAPNARNRDYAASPVYAYALTQEVLPALNRVAPSGSNRTNRVALGASLGALSLFHAHRSYPTVFGGLFLQSGSFFQPHYDWMESEVDLFGPVTRFVGRVLATSQWRRPIPVTLTAGAAEENLFNNRDMRDTLKQQGYDVVWHEQPDAHNWVSWRDCWDPHLVDLLNRAWSE